MRHQPRSSSAGLIGGLGIGGLGIGGLGIGGLGAAVAAVSFIVTLELSTATASAEKVASSSHFMIDRTLKTDRLATQAGRSSNVGAPAAEPALPVGCEPLFSSIGRKIKTGIARHCLS